MKSEKVTKVELGETFKAKVYRGGREEVETFTAQASCGESNGQWFCVTCDKGFDNNYDKHTHIEKGKHRLAWYCRTHGAEVP